MRRVELVAMLIAVVLATMLACTLVHPVPVEPDYPSSATDGGRE